MTLTFAHWLAILAIAAFNIPIVVAAWRFRNAGDFKGILKEKDENGCPTTTSYSRVTGMIGAVVVASLFWMMSNIVIGTAILSPRDVTNVLSNISTIFLLGAALFLPYAF